MAEGAGEEEVGDEGKQPLFLAQGAEAEPEVAERRVGGLDVGVHLASLDAGAVGGRTDSRRRRKGGRGLEADADTDADAVGARTTTVVWISTSNGYLRARRTAAGNERVVRWQEERRWPGGRR